MLLTALLTACSTLPMHAETARFKVLGSLDLTVGDTSQVTRQDFTVASIQLKTGATTYLDHNGYRYISTTYQVRNATSSGTPHPIPRSNLTFLAVDTTSTLGDTAVRTLKKADGTAADPALALKITPSASLAADGGLGVTQSMQAFSASETASLSGLPSSIEAVLPYGFVVDRTGGGRTLDANPAPNQYQGTVTVSVKVPLQDPIENTPRSLTLTMIYVEDSVTQVTESLEEQQASSHVENRVAAAGASRVNVFPGSAHEGPYRLLCSVPLSRTQPVDLLQTAPPSTLKPTSTLLAAANSALKATFTCDATRIPLLSGVTPHNQMIIQAFQTGKRFADFNAFNNGTFSQQANVWTYTPTAPFKPGEEVEVTVPASTGFAAQQSRFRIATAPEAAPGFEDQVTYSTTGSATMTSVGDLNGDGHLDVVVTASNATNIRTFLGNGDGTLGSMITNTTTRGPSASVLGDVNNDGKLDVVVSNPSSNSIGINLGNGDGTFQTQVAYGAGSSPISVALADLDRDGNLDVLVSHSSSAYISVRLGNGNGTFRTQSTYPTGGTSRHMALGDINLDGNLDVLLAGYGSNTIRVLLGNGDGTLQSMPSLASTSPWAVNLADLNEDGRLDAVATTRNVVQVWLGNGDGTFQTVTEHPATSPFGLQVQDMNGDGHMDVLTSSLSIDSIGSLLLGNGDGTLQEESLFAVGENPNMLAAGDFNGDGRLDAVVPNYGSATISVLLKK